MSDCHMLIHVYILTWIAQGLSGQNEICTFYGLEANCRYRIDAISLSHIQAEINQCADPVEVTFKIKNERPYVDFKYTFNSADTLVSVPRFMVEIQLRVRLTKKEDDVINIEADFYVYGQARADFINDDIKLRGLEEHCPVLNTAARIAIGVMGGLAVIAACLIIALVYIRYRRKHVRGDNVENQLVTNVCELGTSTPLPSTTNINEDHVTSINSEETNTNERHGVHADSSTNGPDETVVTSDDNAKAVSGNEQNSNGLDVRFLEVIQQQNLKISNC